MLFKVGDKVVYPMHGAGVIEAIEEREILGERREYYVLRFPIGSNMKVMVPIDNCQEIGLRRVIDKTEVQSIIKLLCSSCTAMPTNWNHRYRANLEKIKSGNIYAVAEVVRNLGRRERERGLSSGEKRMLENAKQILISELVLAMEMQEEEARQLLDRAFA
ncbi:CarD family transcriptional regulator [Desulfothermobacter acidiphilus]|uniref:CarD family transcriptional regulator n=1 Tax=Desulfothermobacter acidiphilus TaxID=1938353 RepID=UPI003F894177